MKNLKKKILIAAVYTASLFLFLPGCSDNSTGPVSDNLDMSVTSNNHTSDKINVLVIDTAKVLIKDIKLNVAAGSQDSTNFKTGIYVVYLNLLSNVNLFGSAYIPPGTYDRLKFEIHKLESTETPPDPDFADANGRYSVVVKGSFNAIHFIYKSTASAHQILSFPKSLAVSASGKSNITLMVEPMVWFMLNGDFMDPLNEANRNNIDNNIKANINNNFKIFVDNNRDGIPD